MTIGQYKSRTTSRQAGFSMLDVLVAIVVLATGLLALAALQGAMTRNGVDSRARSQIGAYTQSVIERMRFLGYDLAAPSTLFAQGDTITPASSCQDGSVTTLTTLQRLQSDAKCVQSAAGVSNFTTTITTAQLYCGTSGSTFAAASACTPDQASYKQLKLTSTWTDSTGTSRSLSFDTTLSQVTATPTNNALTNANFSPGLGSTPVVREANPGKTLGVIPIAVVTGSTDSAATNPKPVVSNTGTTFSTLTYAASNADLTTIQQRVDTKVVQCGCQWGGPVTLDGNLGTILKQPYGPTYWDGTKYVDPAKATANGSGGSDSGINSAVTQDPSCDICCRDRRDDVGNVDTTQAANPVYFDNYTGANTTKYNYVSGVLTALVGKSGAFVQACRMIRVGGEYVAATDAHLNFFDLLATDNCAAETSAGLTAAPNGCTSSLAASDTVPAPATETSYGNFVKQYLYNYFTDLTSSGKPSLASSSPLITTDTNGANVFTGSTYLLNSPANITINMPNTVSRWVYSRGIYIDHLEALAKAALANAIINCGSTVVSDVEDCTLSTLPFTTVNMTELANWTVSDTNVIHISNTAVIGGDESSPKRGNVTVPSTQSGSGDPTAFAIATAYTTNSGLTAVSTNQANSAYDQGTTGSVTDKRQFTVSGTSSGSGNAVYFDVSLTNLDWMTSTSSSNLVPSVSWSGTAAQLGTAASGSSNAYSTKQGQNYTWQYAGASSTVPIPVSITATAPVGITINVQNFNTTANNGSESNVKCYNSDGTLNSSNNSFNNATQCLNYAVNTSAIQIGTTTVSGATASLMSGTTDGGLKEGAVITLPATPGISSTTNTIAGANAVTIPFTLTTTTVAPGTCSCKNSSCNGGNQVYTPGTCAN